MNILYLGVLHERNFFNELVFSKNKKISVSGQRWDSFVCEVLAKNNQVEAFTIISDPTKNRTKTFWRRKPDIQDNVLIKYIPFINISIIKTLTQTTSSFFMIFKWLIKNRGTKEAAVITNLLYLPVNLPALLLCKLFRVNIFCTVTDIPSYLLHFSVQGFKKIFAPLFIFLSNLTAKSYSGYILLTKYMNPVINKKDRPFIILEGMVENDCDTAQVQKHSPPAIMYAGGLFEEFGVLNIVRAMKYIDKDCELWLFGSGDCEEYIKKASESDKRIKFYGLVPHTEILKKEKEAWVLINARSTDDEFTKYSFPSKNLEYMSSGTPVLTTKLPGIPEEYFEYFYTTDDNSPEAIAKELNMILDKSLNELCDFGLKAQEFAKNNKNYIMQVNRVELFLRETIKDAKRGCQ